MGGYKIKGFMAKDMKEVVSIPCVDESEFMDFIQAIEHKKLSDKIIKVVDDKEIHIIINNDLILKEFHSYVNEISDLINYCIAYALSLEE